MSAGRAIVVGGGLSGLACAFDLARAGREVLLLEARERLGGVVGTTAIDGFQFEDGPGTIQASSEEFRRLCGDLGIAGNLIVSSPASDERFLFLRERLVPLPASPLAFLLSPVLSLRSRLYVATEVLRRWRPPPAGAPEPDMRAFVTERLGEEAARVLAGAFVRGVYAAELDELGARSAFPRMWRACEEHGGLVRGLFALSRKPRPDLPGPRASRTALLSFPRGLQEIVDALANALGGRARTGDAVLGLERAGGSWRVRTVGRHGFEAERLVLAVPANVAARLLAPIAPAGFPLEHLRRIAHARVTIAHVGIEGCPAGLPRGFGFLVPPGGEGGAPRALGMIFGSNLFPGRAGEGSLAVSGFYRSEDLAGRDDMAITRAACEDFARATGAAEVPRARAALVRRWSDVIPRCAPGHAQRMEEMQRACGERLPGLHLAGAFVAGVSVEQVIARGRAAAREVLA